jgi:hypothetical protein
MPDKPTIKKIVFSVRGKTLELTKDEARELKDILSDLFGGNQTVYVDRWHPTYPWTYPHWTYTASDLGQSGTLMGLQNSQITSNTLYLNAATES